GAGQQGDGVLGDQVAQVLPDGRGEQVARADGRAALVMGEGRTAKAMAIRSSARNQSRYR
ncbi:MAG TPA: hypothetical protein VN847_01945, partial [Streptosporangiaceae bacterium]|nr:hypothetical protein [Streptosporangiaceae bacterium]